MNKQWGAVPFFGGSSFGLGFFWEAKRRPPIVGVPILILRETHMHGPVNLKYAEMLRYGFKGKRASAFGKVEPPKMASVFLLGFL